MARIGTVGYLNARPLSDRIDIDRHSLLLAHPAEVARQLDDGEVDVALVPVAAALADGDNHIVPGVCIGADGPVASVLLVAEVPPEQWTRVVLDGVSRTSAVLARLLLGHGPLASRVAADLEIVDATPGTAMQTAEGTVAGLVIGDAARLVPERLTHRLDLAELWKDWTGLPFVFAVWAGRADLDPAVVTHLSDAGRAGIEAIPAGYAGADLDYLTNNLRYILDDRALMGLRRFAALAECHGLLPSHHVQLYGPTRRVVARQGVDRWLADAADGVVLEREALLALWTDARLCDLGAAADLRRSALFPSERMPWVLQAKLADGAALESLEAAVAAGASRVEVVGGIDRLAAVATRFPQLACVAGLDPAVDPAPWVEAGLDLLLDEPIGQSTASLRSAASPWHEVEAGLRSALAAGLGVVGSAAVGLSETAEQWVDHLLTLAALHGDTRGLRAVRVWAATGDGAAATQANTAQDYLRAMAFARLVFADGPSLIGSPATEGLGMTQAGLRLGLDHYGVVPLVGAVERWRAHRASVEHEIVQAGFAPLLEPTDADRWPRTPEAGPRPSV